MNIRSYQDLCSEINKRASVKQASTNKGQTKVAGDVVPEEDINDKGTTEIPKDPDGKDTKTIGLAGKTNVEETKVLPAPAVTTVDGPEKAASNLSKQAAGILTGIRAMQATLQKKAAEQGDPATKLEESSGGGQKAKVVTLPAGDTKGELPKSKTNTDDTGKESGKEAAATDEFQIDPSFHLKLASLILATEEGRQFAQHTIEKAHGAEAAADIIKAASTMEELAAKAASEEDAGAQAAEAAWNAMPEAERDSIVKLANFHATIRSGYGTEFEKAAYDQGAMQAAQMQDAGAFDPAAAGGAPAEGGAPAPDAAAGAVPPEGAAAGGEAPDLQTIVAALDQMVQSGELQPDVAAEVLQVLTQGAGGEAGGGEAEAPAAGPVGEGSPAEGPGPDGSAKHESAESPKQEKAEGPKDDEKEAAAAVKKAYDMAAQYVTSLKK